MKETFEQMVSVWLGDLVNLDLGQSAAEIAAARAYFSYFRAR